MQKHNIWRVVRPLLIAGLCLGTLTAAGAVGRWEASPLLSSWLRLSQELTAHLQKGPEVYQEGAPSRPRTGLADEIKAEPEEPVWLTLPNGREDRLERYLAWAEAHPEDPVETAVFQVNLDQDQAFYSAIQEIQDPDSLTVLVNKHYALPNSYVPQLETLGAGYGGGSMRPEAAQAFRAMSDAARREGVSLYSVSAYRSYQTQRSAYNGYLRNASQAYVDTFSARPGHSEHQTGLAVDINVATRSANFERTPAFAWLKEHCAEYGFILRYLEDKQDITGYRFEPWHYRYVGEEAARACMDQGLAYEEYIALLPN